MAVVELELFSESCKVGKKLAQNRFLAQPIERNHANEIGGFSDYVFNAYKQLRDGLWGVVIMETTAISMSEKCRPNALVLDDTLENEESWSKFFKEMKNPPKRSGEGETLWIVEITAAGYKNISGPRRALYEGQRELRKGPVMSTEDIEDLLDDYVRATRLAYERGADGIDIKLCHGYFGSLFLRPNNQREDQYGGTHENRTRFLKEYARRASKEVGDSEFLFTTRINAWDGGILGGIGMDGHVGEGSKAWIRNNTEIEKNYELLDELGFSLANVSTGLSTPSGIINPQNSIPVNFLLYQDAALHAARHLKNIKSDIKVASAAWSAMGPFSLSAGEGYLEKGLDFIGFGRWIICEPNLPKIVLKDAKEANMDPAEYLEEEGNICIACGKCGSGLGGDGPVKCPVYD
ncbi:MAG: hypothetical protein ACFFCS_19850 [Candidatus Hodarchaeota archaeon]